VLPTLTPPRVSLESIRGRRVSYLARRSVSLARRYGFRDGKAKERILRCVRALADYGLAPTFATPGSVIERAPEFFRELQAMGVEFAVHGYNHVDFRPLDHAAIREQFERAIDSFQRHGIAFEGFRCPYLSYTDKVAKIVPEGTFAYSSNEAISWDVLDGREGTSTSGQLEEFYAPAPATEAISTPYVRGPFVEIPVSLPDDLQLLDGFGLKAPAISNVWKAAFDETYGRGELFGPLFHPESFDSIQPAVRDVVDEMRARQPKVWMTQLREIARWWRERESSEARTSTEGALLRIDFHGSKRATVLARDWPDGSTTATWGGRYSVVNDKTMRFDARTRPFVGLRGTSERTASILREQGYILELGEEASSCTVCIDRELASRFERDAEIVAHIESTAGPLLKFSPWPDGAKSAFYLAGDLDALSLREYTRRLLPREQ
jgi:peptidoglycan/xylan/chitin deacetylase (PgdA/CDA1 family)